MSHSLRAKLSGMRYKGILEDKDYKRLCHALDLEKAEQEQKSGKWIAVYQGDEIINYRCSECELGDTNGSTNLYGWDYCRRCGAKILSHRKVRDKECTKKI